MTVTDFIKSILKRFNNQDTMLKIIEIIIAAGMLVVAILSMKQSEVSVTNYAIYEPPKSGGYINDYPVSMNINFNLEYLFYCFIIVSAYALIKRIRNVYLEYQTSEIDTRIKTLHQKLKSRLLKKEK